MPRLSSGQRVLIVEDDAGNARLFEKIVAAQGYIAMTVRDADQAAAHIADRSFTAAIIDKNLPTGSGLDVLRSLSERQPATQAIVLTADATVDSAMEAVRLGAFDYLTKPVPNECLAERVDAAVQKYEAIMAAAEARAHERARTAQVTQDYQQLVDLIPGLVLFFSSDGRFQAVNERGAEALGYQTRELVGASFDTLLPKDAAPPSHWVFKERRRGERALTRETVPLQHKDGSTRLFEMTARGAYRPNLDEPSLEGTLAIGWEVTEKASLIEQLRQSQKMEAVGSLAGGVAHDFNNLLTVINQNAIELRGHVTVAGGELLTEVAEAAGQAAMLTKQLLAFSGKSLQEPRVINVGSVVTRIAPVIQRLLGAHVLLTTAIEHQESLVFLAGGLLEQIVVNLAVNARDAMPDGGELRVRVRPVDLRPGSLGGEPMLAPGPHVEILVEDEGSGITPEALPHLFEPFFTTKAPGEGTGLGLSVVYGIVSQAGGTITAESELGRGTRFRVLLPTPDERGGAGAASPASPLEVKDSRSRVLLAEDQRLLRNVLVRSLSSAGFDVTSACDGVEALGLLQEVGHGFRVLVTDLRMPRMGGAELAKKARAMPGLLGIVYMSGNIGEAPDNTPLEQEFVRVLQKPITAAALKSAVDSLIEDLDRYGDR